MTKERLIELFKFEPSGPNKDVYLLEFEYRKQSFLEYKSLLNELIKKGSVKVLKKTTKKMLCQYFEKELK